jgi:hypothetical protein
MHERSEMRIIHSAFAAQRRVDHALLIRCGVVEDSRFGKDTNVPLL